MTKVKIKYAWKLFDCNGRGISTAIVDDSTGEKFDYEEACGYEWRTQIESDLESIFSVPARCLIYDVDEISLAYNLKKIYYKTRNFFRRIYYRNKYTT